jgi:hypothetical protein
MYFFERKGWYCQFLEEDYRTPLPKKLDFKYPDKIIELAMRGGAASNLEGRQAIDQPIIIRSGTRTGNGFCMSPGRKNSMSSMWSATTAER